jgi:hypothetical protein
MAVRALISIFEYELDIDDKNSKIKKYIFLKHF